MPVELIANEQFSFIASYTPYDSLTELVEALRSFLKSGQPRLARWNTEPVEYEFVFSEASNQAKLKVFKYPNHQRLESAAEIVFLRVTNSRISLVLSFWRALRAFETTNHLAHQWHWTFPTREMDLLKEQIKVLKA